MCYAHRRSRDKDKFGDRSRKCIFVGYPYCKKAWQLYDLTTKDFFSSRDVVFSESKFPGVDSDDYVRPPTNYYDNTIEDWLLPAPQSRGISPHSQPEPSTTATPSPAPMTTTTTDPTEATPTEQIDIGTPAPTAQSSLSEPIVTNTT